MRKVLQIVLLVAGVVALIGVIVEIGISLAATTHSGSPVKVFHVQAGPYPLIVSLYKDHADAGYALPFAISSTQPLAYDVTSIPQRGVIATPVRASISPDASNRDGVQGDAEITVRGNWVLHIIANGPQGQGMAEVPIIATAPSAIPTWLGWLIGAIPLAGLFVFLFMLQGRRARPQQTRAESQPETDQVAP